MLFHSQLFLVVFLPLAFLAYLLAARLEPRFGAIPRKLALLFGADHVRWDLALPLGISFFTFQQISYLADRARAAAPRYGLADYALYVTFFPQLIAGPIVRHDELIAQFARPPLAPGAAERLGRGLTWLAIGVSVRPDRRVG